MTGYEILGELGRGGMGVVYKARHLQLGRTVALKMILAGGHAGAADLARFQTEAEAVARLQHPGIVQIHETGLHQGLPYFSLEFVEGGSLDRKLNGTPLPPKPAARLTVLLAQAMRAAHENGILHRDLKPANVFLKPTKGKDGVPIEDRNGSMARYLPKIGDFGLAKKLDDEAQGQTQSGSVMGTPAYMAPEQAAGKSKELTPAADIYALGAILYELQTGRPPFRGATPLDTIMQVVADEPVRPSQLNPKTPSDLETICLKCLRKDPKKRYSSAQALAKDLERFLAGEPIRARAVGRIERTWRWCRRNPAVAGLLATVALVLLLGASVGTGLAGWALTEKARADSKTVAAQEAKLQAQKDAERATQAEQDTRKAASRAETEKGLAVQERDRAEMSVYVNCITLAQAEWEHGRAALAWQHLQACQQKLRGWEHDYLVTLFNKTPTFRGHTGRVTSVAFSPDGKRIVSGSWDQTVKVWDAGTGTEALSLKGHTITSVAFSPDGKRIASGSWDKTVKVWDAATGTETLSLKRHTGWVTSVAFSSDGKRIVSGSGGLDAQKKAVQEVRVWDAGTGTETLSLKGHTSWVNSVAFSADGKRIVSGSRDNTVKVWDADTGTETLSLKGHTGPVTSVAFSPDGKRIVSGSGGFDDHGRISPGEVKVWDAATGTEALSLKGHTALVTSVAFSPDGKRIVSGSEDNTVKVWDAATGTEALSLKGHTGPVTSVAFSPDGKRIVSGSWDNTVKVWDAEKGTEALALKGHTSGAFSLAFSPDGKRIVSAGVDNTMKVWDAAMGTESLSLPGQTNGVAFSPDSKRIVGGSGEGTVKVWDAQKGTETLSLKGHTGPVTSVAFSPDGKRIASGSSDKTVKIWDAGKSTATLSLKGHAGPVTSVAFSPDGQRIVSGSEDNTVKVWDAEKGTEMLSLKGHTGPVTS